MKIKFNKTDLTGLTDLDKEKVIDINSDWALKTEKGLSGLVDVLKQELTKYENGG